MLPASKVDEKAIEKEILQEQEDKIAKMADWTWKNFKGHVQMLEKGPISKGMSIDEHEVAMLGHQFKHWYEYKHELSEQGSLGALGQIPKIALDVITANYATNPVSLMASVQPIDGRKGIVWFRQMQANLDRGDVNADDVLTDPRSLPNTPIGYASNELSDVEVLAATVDTQVAYTFTLPGGGPILPQYLKLRFDQSSAVVAEDVKFGANRNQGLLYGRGLSGTVNYQTGEVTVTFAENPGAGGKLFGTWQQDLEKQDDIQSVSSFLDSTDIRANVYALKQTMGLMQNFTLRKSFGRSGFEQMAQDLMMETQKEIAGDVVRKLRAIASTTGAAGTSFSIQPGNGESFAERVLQWNDELYKREEVLQQISGRGKIAALVLGRRHAAYVKNHPKFESVYDGHAQGVHYAGRLNGINIISVPETKLLGRTEGIAIYKGTSSSYEAPVTYSPYMPLVLTDLLPEGKNPLSNMRAAATMAGVEGLVPNYAVRFDITEV